MSQPITVIQNYQLMYSKYDIESLEHNINRLSLRNLVKTQVLTVEFCRKYILHPEEYAMCNEDHYISKEDIVIYQPHITLEQLNSNKYYHLHRVE